MSRVLLFVQTGDAHTKVFKQFAREWRDDPNFLEQARDYAEAVKCDRWWLVECANAKDGVTLIGLTELVQAARRYMSKKLGREVKPAPVFCPGQVPPGRILASGGRP